MISEVYWPLNLIAIGGECLRRLIGKPAEVVAEVRQSIEDFDFAFALFVSLRCPKANA